jgi:hypothetical protein
VKAPARCIVCGSGTGLVDRRGWRDDETGAVVSRSRPREQYEYVDGTVAVSCPAHTADEVRTAFVLAERLLVVRPVPGRA